MKSHITPNNIHYVRNHGGIPTVPNTDVFSIKVGGLVKNPGELLFKDLVDPAKFPQEEMTITLQCSGTRRVEQIALYPGEGDGESQLSAAFYMLGQYAYRTAFPRIAQRVSL
jgi:sulfite oxidase